MGQETSGLKASKKLNKTGSNVSRSASRDYRDLLLSPFEAILIHKEGLILDANRSFTELFGYNIEELVGESGFMLLATDCHDLVKEKIRTGDEHPYEAMGVKKDGTRFSVEIIGKEHSLNGKSVRMACVRDISRYARTADEKKQTLSLLQSILDSTADGLLVVDKEGKIVTFNQRFAHMWRIPENVLETRNDRRVLAHVLYQLAHPKSFLKKVKELYSQPEAESFDVLEFTDGRVFERYSTPHQVDGIPIGRIWSFRDVTEQNWAREALRKSQERYRTLVEASSECICHLDLDGNFLYMSPSGLRSHKLTEDEIAGVACTELVKPTYKKLLLETLEAAKGGQAVKFEYESVTRYGTRWFESVLTPIKDRSDKVVSLLRLSRDITDHKQAEKAIKQSFSKLERTLEETVNTLASITEKKDPYTAGHQHRVTQLACAIAKELGLSPEVVEGIRIAATLHDIGKIHVPAEILSKPARLSETEMSLIKTHSEVGYEILKSIPFTRPVAKIVLQHQERIDGSGYPHGIPGDEMLPEALILAVADVVEAIASHRPYRPALGIEAALEEIRQNRGRLYDPDIVDICINLFKRDEFKFD